jgi:hypothetical protein
MAWYKARPTAQPIVMSDEDKAFFKTLISPENSARAQELKMNLMRALNDATSYYNSANEKLAIAGTRRSELDAYLMRGGKDLSEEVLKACADGWYTYDAEQTKLMNKYWDDNGYQARRGITFKTKPVTISYFNKQAGVEMTVPLGTFYVDVRPLVNHIQVRKCEGNTEVSEYYHPHISTGAHTKMGASVCWGNAAHTMTTSMGNLEFSKALNALRIIFTTYNSDSPYITLAEFHSRIDPRTLYGGNTEYKQYGDKGLWVYSDEIPHNFDPQYEKEYAEEGEEDSNGDYVERSRHLMKVFRLMPTGSLAKVHGTYYFIRLTDGTFYHLSEEQTNGWDT